MSYPTDIRGIGTGWAQGMIRLGTIIGFYFFPVLLAALGINRMMLFLALAPLLGLVALMAIPWEPVGANVEADDDIIPGRAAQEAGSPSS